MEMILLAKAIAVFGAAVAIAGGGIGVGMVGSKALEAIARQPQEKKDIRTNMILAAALIEGLAFFGAILGLLVIFMN